jgi:hypothetical protein
VDVDQEREIRLASGGAVAFVRHGDTVHLHLTGDINRLDRCVLLTLDEARLMIAAWQPLVFTEEESHGAEATTSS